VIRLARGATIRGVMLRTALLAVGAGLLLAGTAGPAGSATALGSDLPITQTDPVGDVTVFDGGGTKPTTGQRRTIDLTSFSVVRHGAETRFSFTIARIAAGRTFDQVVAVSFGRGAFNLLANPQHRKGTAISADSYCLVDVSTSKKTGTVRVDVPDDCLPEGRGVLRVSTYLQEKNGSGPGFSEDTLRVTGQVTF